MWGFENDLEISNEHGLYDIFICIGYFLYLHFKCPPLGKTAFPTPAHCAPMRVFPTYPPIHPLLLLPPCPQIIPTLGNLAFTGPRASPLINAWQGHSLLQMLLELWVPPYVLLGCWFAPCELGWGASDWLIFLCFLWGCKPLQLLQSFL